MSSEANKLGDTYLDAGSDSDDFSESESEMCVGVLSG